MNCRSAERSACTVPLLATVKGSASEDGAVINVTLCALDACIVIVSEPLSLSGAASENVTVPFGDGAGVAATHRAGAVEHAVVVIAAGGFPETWVANEVMTPPA